MRAWRGLDRFEGRAALRSWLYRIATNVCLDMLGRRERRARPMDLGPAQEPVAREPEHAARGDLDRADPRRPRRPGRRRRRARDDPARVRRRAAAPAAAPARGADPLRGAPLAGDRGRRAARDDRRVGQQRAAAGPRDARRGRAPTDGRAARRGRRARCSTRYVAAFEAYDIEALTALIREDASQSMPPYDLWLCGRDDIFAWWFGPGHRLPGLAGRPGPDGERLARVRPVQAEPRTAGYEPWALQVRRARGGGIGELTFFLDTERLFPLFGLPLSSTPEPSPRSTSSGRQGEQIQQLARGPAQPDLQAAAACGELEPRQLVDGHGVGSTPRTSQIATSALLAPSSSRCGHTAPVGRLPDRARHREADRVRLHGREDRCSAGIHRLKPFAAADRGDHIDPGAGSIGVSSAARSRST